MIDANIVASRLSTIEQCFEMLGQIKEKGFSHYQSDFGTRLMAERALHLVIESCIDISNHIIAVRGFRRPKDYADVFKILGEQDLLNEDLTKRLINMARFRHRLVHLYSTIDDRLVFSFIETDLKDILDFSRVIAQML